VRIASPPVPISPETPASYASSPEETRYASLPTSSPPISPEIIPYAQALALNPFQTSLSDGERDDADDELLENTWRNSSLGSKPEDDSRKELPDTVTEALARVATLPRRAAALPPFAGGDQNEPPMGKASRPALDVDAFKRLLLTGVSELPANETLSASTHISSHPALNSGSSSSVADTASLSQHSVFEPLPPIPPEMPRTSHELDEEEAIKEEEALIIETTMDKKPPVPRPRHGKPLSRTSTAPLFPISHVVTQVTRIDSVHPPEDSRIPSPSDVNKPLPLPPIDNSFPRASDPMVSDTLQSHSSIQRPPTPPVPRRRSQRRSQFGKEVFDGSYAHLPAVHIGGTSPVDQEPTTGPAKAPPPPPTRRQKRTSAIGLQSSEPTVQEEGDACITATQLQLSPASSMTSLSQFKPQPSPSRNPSAATRISLNSTSSPPIGPPLPPPRRARGSSRSSFDSQGTVPSHELPHRNEVRRPSTDSVREVSGQHISTDILADLAALQLEVDMLRNKQKAG